MIRQNQFTFRHSIENRSNLVELIEEHFALVLNIMPTVRTARWTEQLNKWKTKRIHMFTQFGVKPDLFHCWQYLPFQSLVTHPGWTLSCDIGNYSGCHNTRPSPWRWTGRKRQARSKESTSSFSLAVVSSCLPLQIASFPQSLLWGATFSCFVALASFRSTLFPFENGCEECRNE